MRTWLQKLEVFVFLQKPKINKDLWSHLVYAKENYSLQYRWIAVDLYLAASQFSKHQSLATTW